MKVKTNNSPAEHARLRQLLRDVTRAVELAGPDHQLTRSLRQALRPRAADAGIQPGWRAISKENAAAGTNEDSPSFTLGPQFLQVLPAS